MLGDRGAIVRRAAFQALLAGRAIGAADLAGTTGVARDEVARALQTLVAQGRIALDAAGVVVAAGGLSAVRSRHRLRLGDRDFHTGCAIDAIGIPAALGSDAVAETACPHCGRELTIEMQGGAALGEPGYVAWDPGAACANVMEEYCPEANLSCGHAHLDAWRAEHGDPPGRALSLGEVAELGRDWWGDLT